MDGKYDFFRIFQIFVIPQPCGIWKFEAQSILVQNFCLVSTVLCLHN